jgi:hypothetical protein
MSPPTCFPNKALDELQSQQAYSSKTYEAFNQAPGS